jgi:hypothetical protein
MAGVRPVILKSNEQAAAVMRGYRERLHLPQDEIDHRVGWADGYTAKAEAPGREYGRAVTVGSFVDWAQAMGLKVVLLDAEGAETLVLLSEEPPVCESHHRAYPNRDRKREVVTRRVLTTRVRFTDAA